MIVDPIENDPQYKAVMAEVEAEIEGKYPGRKDCMGFCHIFWREKKILLKEKYNIDWKSPAELNPWIMFD